MAANAVERIRVLHLVKTAGGASWALRQMKELVKLGVEVHVAVPPGPLVPEYERSGIRVHFVQTDISIHTPWLIPTRNKGLRALVIKVKPDLIHSHFVGTTLTMRLALRGIKGIPKVFQVPGPLHLEHPFYGRGEILLASRQDYWIGSCEYTCKLYERMGVSPDKMFLSYYGTDLERFSCPKGGKLREELGLPPTEKVVGMVAYMYPPKWYLGQRRGLKGHEDFVDALAICQDRGLKVAGVVVGGAWGDSRWYERKLKDYARMKCKEGVTFLGTRNDVPRLYPDFDLVVHPSHSENVGGAVESLLLGVPTITTRVGGFPELVRDGETGWLVPPKNPERLAEKLTAILRDPAGAKECALRGQKLAREMFDVKATAKQVFNIYSRILHA